MQKPFLVLFVMIAAGAVLVWRLDSAAPDISSVGMNKAATNDGDSSTPSARSPDDKNRSEESSSEVVSSLQGPSRQDEAPRPRFDPSAWPPLPDAGFRTADHIASMRARADKGDAGAACWLAIEFTQCQFTRTIDRRVRGRTYSGKDAGKGGAKELAWLANEESRLAALAHCQGVTEADTRDTLHYLRQAALGGSKPALNRIIDHDAVSLGPGFPDGDLLRNVLEERDAYLIAGLKGGVPSALEAILLQHLTSMPFGARIPGRPSINDRDRDALFHIVKRMAERIAAREGKSIGDFSNDPLVSTREGARHEPDEATRVRLDRQIDAWMLDGWAEDRSWVDVGDGWWSDRMSRGCSVFTNPVDVHVDLKDLLQQ